MKAAIESNATLCHLLTARWQEAQRAAYGDESVRGLLHWLMGARAAAPNAAIWDEISFLWELQMGLVYGAVMTPARIPLTAQEPS